MKRKAFALFLALTLMFSMFSLAVMAEDPAVTADTDVVGTLNGEEMTLAQFKAATGGDIVLTENIVVNTWTSIATFNGTLEGGNKSISGVTAALFDSFTGTLKNLTVSGNVDRTVSENIGSAKAALFANTAGSNVTVENCIANGSVKLTYTANYAYVGGFFGMAGTGLKMTDCINNSNVRFDSLQTFYGGGFVGNMPGNATFTGCVNTGSVISDGNTKTNLIGGFVGCQPNANTTVTFEKCANYGKVESTAGANGSKCGGILGVAMGAGTSAFSNCANYGSVTAVAMAGGILGDAQSEMKINGCFNFGEIKATQASNNAFAGGIIAYARSAAKELHVANCANFGAVVVTTNSNGFAGGIVAVSDDNFDEFHHNVNKGNLECKKYSAGMIGKLNSGNATTISNCLSFGTATGSSAVVIGLNNQKGAVTFNACYGLNTYQQAVYYNAGGAKWTCNGIVAPSKENFNAAILKTEDEINKQLDIRSLNVQISKIENGTFNVRLIAGLDDLSYSATGFELIRVEQNGKPSSVVSKSTSTVYRAVKGYDESGTEIEYQSNNLNSDYLSAIAINGVPADKTVTFIVRPYMASTNNDGTPVNVYGSTYAVTFVNGVLQNRTAIAE